MTATYHPSVHRFAVFVVFWTILLLIAGALVTSNEAALAVPDWPLSYGTLTPPMVGGIVYEHSHRLIAGGLGILAIVLAVWVWAKDERRWLRWFSVIAVLGIVAQAILGGEVVRQLLHYWLPVIHACFAQIMFAALLSIAVLPVDWWVSDRPQVEDSGSPSIHSLAILNAAIIYFQVILGAGFRHSDIPVWPHMAGALVVPGHGDLDRRCTATNASQNPRLSPKRAFCCTPSSAFRFARTLALTGRGLTTADAPQPMPVMVTLTVISHRNGCGIVWNFHPDYFTVLSIGSSPKGGCRQPRNGRWPFNEHGPRSRTDVDLPRQCLYCPD